MPVLGWGRVLFLKLVEFHGYYFNVVNFISFFFVAVIMNILVVLSYIKSLFPIRLPSSFNWLNVTDSLLENELMPNTSDFVKSAL